jgi:hypothetical protein
VEIECLHSIIKQLQESLQASKKMQTDHEAAVAGKDKVISDLKDNLNKCVESLIFSHGKELPKVSDVPKLSEPKPSDVPKLSEPKPEHNRKKAFTLKSLMDEMDLQIDRQFMPAIGKAVSLKFKKQYPESETFTRHKTAFFYDEDKAALEEIVRKECSKSMARRVEEQERQTPAGPDGPSTVCLI